MTPHRTAEWYEEDGLVHIRLQKFDSRWGKWLCRALKKPNFATIKLDDLGSSVWKHCDGATTVGNMLNQLHEKMGNTFEKEGMGPRSYYFLHMLRNRGLLTWKETPNIAKDPE